MTKNDTKLQHYHSLRQKEFNFLSKLEIEQTGSMHAQSLQIVIELLPSNLSESNAEKLVLSFKGVRKLRIIQADWSVVQFPLLEVRDIRQRQLESLSYEVVDNEHNVLSFMCRDFDAVRR